MKNKKGILLVILFMTIGFATVSTSLFIDGSTNISSNNDDFNVYFSDALVNGVRDLSVVTDDTHLSFVTTLQKLGEKYILDYQVTNGSKNYDAQVDMVCTGGNEYLTLINEFDDETILEAQKKRNGTLTLELSKSYSGDDMIVVIECVINANAVERESLGIDLGYKAEDFEYIDKYELKCNDVQCAIEELNRYVDEVY